MAELLDAVVAGLVCLDITPDIPAGAKTIGELFRPGALIHVGGVTVSTGGPVSNTGFPLRRLGMNVKLMGKCGDDAFGRAIIELIKAEAPGAEAGMRIVPGENSSYTVVINPPGIDRIFLHCPGANDTFGAEDIDEQFVARARLFHFGYPPLMARTYANGGAELTAILRSARSAGATTSLDLAYPDPASPAGKADWASILAAALAHADLFTPSVEELTFMLRREKFDELAQRAGQGELLAHIDGDLLCDLGERCLEAGAAVVLIKCGYVGLYVRTAGRDRLAALGRAPCGDIDRWANRELLEPSYAVGRIVSATGAGDCAIAGFLAAFLHGLDVDDALRYACAVGAQNLRAADSISGVRTWEQTARQVGSRPAKNDVAIDLDGWRHDEAADHYVGPSDAQASGQAGG
jgi:sugar/nucleoside kinase (ribokinase family)